MIFALKVKNWLVELLNKPERESPYKVAWVDDPRWLIRSVKQIIVSVFWILGSWFLAIGANPSSPGIFGFEYEAFWTLVFILAALMFVFLIMRTLFYGLFGPPEIPVAVLKNWDVQESNVMTKEVKQ